MAGITEQQRFVLSELWQLSVETGALVDAPSFCDDHEASISSLGELEGLRFIARDGDNYRLTPLGLRELDDQDAQKTLEIGNQVWKLLRAHYKNPATRKQQVLCLDAAKALGMPLPDLSFALQHLVDAVDRWCSGRTTDLSQPTAFLHPDRRVMGHVSLLEVAEQLEAAGIRQSTPHDVDWDYRESPKRKQAVILVHGIRTQGEWQQATIDAFGPYPEFQVFPFRYEFFDLVRFLLPFGMLRKGPVTRVEQLVRDALSQEDIANVSVICHSFGTWIVSQILERTTDIRFHRIIMCGSVVADQFEWDRYKAQLGDSPERRGFVVNDCGMRDIWPVLAKAVTWGYGSSGRFGYGHPRVIDRFHEVGHSDFLKPDFVRKYWLPFLLTGEIVQAARTRPTTPWWVSLLTVLQLKYVVAAAIFWFAMGGVRFLVEGQNGGSSST